MNDAVKKEQDMIATPLHAEETEDAIERHFAIDLLDVINEKIKNGEPFPYEAAKRFIEKIPAAQFKQTEIIFCKDCIHSDIYPKGAYNDMPLKCLGIRYGGVMPDWYCEHAERRA